MAALEILPLIPPHKLEGLMAPEASFSGSVTRQMSTSVKEVSATAVASVGRWLSNPVSTDVLARVTNIASTAKSWATVIAEATLDPSQALTAAAFDAARQVSGSPGHASGHNSKWKTYWRWQAKKIATPHRGMTTLPEGTMTIAQGLLILVFLNVTG